jgi:hypothetical protein
MTERRFGQSTNDERNEVAHGCKARMSEEKVPVETYRITVGEKTQEIEFPTAMRQEQQR